MRQLLRNCTMERQRLCTMAWSCIVHSKRLSCWMAMSLHFFPLLTRKDWDWSSRAKRVSQAHWGSLHLRASAYSWERSKTYQAKDCQHPGPCFLGALERKPAEPGLSPPVSGRQGRQCDCKGESDGNAVWCIRDMYEASSCARSAAVPSWTRAALMRTRLGWRQRREAATGGSDWRQRREAAADIARVLKAVPSLGMPERFARAKRFRRSGRIHV